MFKLEKNRLNPQHQHNVIGRTYQEHNSRGHKIKDANSIKSGSTLIYFRATLPRQELRGVVTIYIYSIFNIQIIQSNQ